MDYENFLQVHLVPLISSPLEGGNPTDNGRVSSIYWDGERLQTKGGSSRWAEHLSELDDFHDRSTKLILDIAGVNDSNADFGGLKKALRRGGPYWLEAGAEDEDDLFDVLTLDPSIAALGSLRAESLEIFEQAMEISDACIPMLYLQDGDVHFKTYMDGLDAVCRSMTDMGYDECIIMDLDSLGGPMDKKLWDRVSSLDISCIPAGGIDPEDITYLARTGYKAAVFDPRIVSKPQYEDSIRPLETEHTISKPRHSGHWTGL